METVNGFGSSLSYTDEKLFVSATETKTDI